ncbi:MAG: M1 family metallopeptidase [Bacteroidales bacterium]|nr:M1 family metallopeptidase [Bacteroidales bacterium]
MRKIAVCVVFVLFVHQASNLRAQSNPLPAEVKKAFRKGSRSTDGKPGPMYWQNRAKYRIEAKLLSAESALRGSESVVYFNNSPDTLRQMVIRIYADLYKEGTARNWPLGTADLSDGMQYENLKVFRSLEEGDLIARMDRTPTNLILHLKTGIFPGDSVVFEADWRLNIPKKKWVRMGNYGADKFFVSYWYPQIAVYDDIDGWDKMEYFGMVEFYNDFNDFDVKITAPPGFVLWATGKLENENSLFSNHVMKQLELARKSDELVKIITADDRKKRRVLKSKKENTWHFTARGVTDFSFAASTQANWEGSSVVVDKSTGRRVLAGAVYPDKSRAFVHAAEWSRKSVAYLSDELPGYPFPYAHMTSFNNGRRGGGMETPMMANDGDPENEANAYATLFHEISHTYFPFFMGTNERKYAWMDEGWAAFFPIGFMEKYYPGYYYLNRIKNRFEGLSGTEKEATLMTLSYQIGDYNSYRIHAYNRPAMAYYYLQDALGDSLFKLSLHAYIDRWHGRHPIPYDFFNTFSDVTGQDLGWFFNPWFFNRCYADLGIRKVTLDNQVVVENYGGLPLPVKLVAEFTDGSTVEVVKNTAVWRTNNPAIVVQFTKDKQLKKVILGDESIPDTSPGNNVVEIEIE